MRFYIFIILFLCFQDTSQSQNLLANGGFEDENICSEYKKNCSPEAWICSSLVSNYYFDVSSWAFEGRHFVGLIEGNSQQRSARSFIRSRLLSSLRKGHQY